MVRQNLTAVHKYSLRCSILCTPLRGEQQATQAIVVETLTRNEVMARIHSHVVETKSKDCIRSRIDSFGENGSYLFRELTERDYGIDGIIECFEDGVPTGKIAFVQVKETSKEIISQKHRPVVACSGISSSNLQYTEQDRIPVVLLYVSIQEPCPIYYADLRVAAQHIRVREDVETVTVHIPEENCTTEDISGIIGIINSYYL